MGWGLIILLAIIAGLLIALAVAWARTGGLGGGGGGGGAPPAPPPWLATSQQLQNLITGLQDSGQSPTQAECQQIQSLLQQMINQGAPAASTDALQVAIDELCP